MNFLLGKFLQSLLKKVIAALVAFVTGPTLSHWLTTLGVTVNPTQLSVGLFALLEGLRTWLTHQSWSAKLPKWVLNAL